MKEDLDLDGDRLNYINAACKFYFTLYGMSQLIYTDEVGYVVFQIPSNLVLIKYPYALPDTSWRILTAPVPNTIFPLQRCSGACLPLERHLSKPTSN